MLLSYDIVHYYQIFGTNTVPTNSLLCQKWAWLKSSFPKIGFRFSLLLQSVSGLLPELNVWQGTCEPSELQVPIDPDPSP